MWQQIESNKRKTIILLTLMTSFLFVFSFCCAFMISDDITEILIYNVIFWIVFIGMFIYGYKRPLSSFGDNIYKCSEKEDKTLFNIVSEMKIASGLTVMPEIYILDSNILNAFACGTNEKNAKIVVSKGLLKTLNRDELQGVVAHEIAHIVNRDTCYLLYASIIVNIIANISNIFFRSTLRGRRSSSSSQSSAALLVIAIIFMIIAPLLASIFYFTLSRKREYLADACSAQFTRYPEGLANALKKISEKIENTSSESINELKQLSTPLAKASYIVPLKAKTENDSLFSTHPSTKNRINILLSMTNSSRADFEAYNSAYENVTNSKNLIKLSNSDRKAVPIRETLEVANVGAAAMGFVGGEAVSVEQTQAQDVKQEVEKEIRNHREVEDLMWNLAHYVNIDCSCGTKLRVPPSYIGQTIVCPHCKQPHIIKES